MPPPILTIKSDRLKFFNNNFPIKRLTVLIDLFFSSALNAKIVTLKFFKFFFNT